MRELNPREKELIKKIINNKVFYFRDLFSKKFLSNVKLAISLKTKDVEIFRSKDIDEIRDIFEEIVTVIGLVRLLEKNDLLLKVQIEFPLEHVYYFGNLDTENQPKTKFIFGDDSLKLELGNYILAEFFITEELRTFYRNKFKTREQIQHRQILWTSWIAIILAFVTSLYAICSKEENKRQDNLEVIDSLKTMDIKIDSLKVELDNKRKSDTIEVE